MVKDANIIIRVDDATKRRFEEAARERAQSMTTFLVEAGEQAAKRKPRPARTLTSGGVPTYFRARCLEASHGGTGGYEEAGWHLAIHLETEVPYDADADEWADELGALVDLLNAEDDDGALAWFDRHYSKCMALVPARRRAQFLKGVQRVHDERRL